MKDKHEGVFGGVIIGVVFAILVLIMLPIIIDQANFTRSTSTQALIDMLTSDGYTVWAESGLTANRVAIVGPTGDTLVDDADLYWTGDYLDTAVGRTATYVVAASNAPAHVIAQADYTCDGTADNVQIQLALDALTSGRTWIETVKLIGDFTTAAALSVPSYTCLDLREASITLADGDFHGIQNSDSSGGNSFISIIGGYIDFNGAGHSAGYHGIRLQKVSDVLIQGMYLYDSQAHLINIVGNEVDDTIVNYRIKIIGNTIDTSQLNGSGLIAVSSEQVVVSNNVVKDVSLDGLQVKSCNYVTFSGNSIDSVGRAGLQEAPGVAVDCVNITFTGNTVSNCTTQGILSYGNNTIISGNTVKTCTSDGIRAEGTDVSITGNRVEGARYGIYLSGTSRASIIGNVSVANTRDGLNLSSCSYNVVSGNVFANAGASYNGIGLYGTTNNTLIDSNQLIDTQGSPTQKYGVRENDTADYNIIKDNKFYNNVTSAVLIIGSNTKVSHNTGYITENSGLATVLNGTTSIIFAHGLATTPTRVWVTPAENPTSAVTFWWVSNLTTTNCTINVDADPGASNLDFNWRAVYGEGN